MEYIKVKQDCFIVFIPVIKIKHKPFKFKGKNTLIQKRVIKPNYK